MLFHCFKHHVLNEYGLFLAPHLQRELITIKILLGTSAQLFLGEIPEINSRKGGLTFQHSHFCATICAHVSKTTVYT